jgi:hypothetical protein
VWDLWGKFLVHKTCYSKYRIIANSNLAAGRAERAVRRDGDGVNVSAVADVVGLEAAVGQIPDLDDLVPAGRHDHRVGVGRRETHVRHPVRVTILLQQNSIIILLEQS